MVQTSQPNPPSRILVIRRDNIGDLVCTTPLFSLLRQSFPQAWIGAWVNSYNAPVLDGNPDVDEVFVYTKAKHRAAEQSLLGVFWHKLQLLRRLRQMQLDTVIIATTSPQLRLVRMARWLKPRCIIAYGPCGADIELPLDDTSQHEVEDVLRAAAALGVELPTTPESCLPCRIYARTQPRDRNLVAVHISARKPSQRWPAENFVALLRSLHAHQPHLRFRLFWAPGAENDPLHPGDDIKAAAIITALGQDFPVEPCATQSLTRLIEGLSGCNRMICADGGAMHLAAGLGLAIVCLFGNSGAQRWRPWGPPHQLLQKSSLEVSDLSPAEVAEAFNALPADTPVTAAATQA